MELKTLKKLNTILYWVAFVCLIIDALGIVAIRWPENWLFMLCIPLNLITLFRCTKRDKQYSKDLQSLQK